MPQLGALADFSRGPSVDSRLDRLAREGERGRDDGEDPGGPPGEDGVPDAGGVGAARAVLDGMARTYSSLPPLLLPLRSAFLLRVANLMFFVPPFRRSVLRVCGRPSV